MTREDKAAEVEEKIPRAPPENSAPVSSENKRYPTILEYLQKSTRVFNGKGMISQEELAAMKERAGRNKGNKAKAEIEAATTPEGIEEVLSTAKEEITVLTEDLTTVQPDMDALWLWIIVAIVISAALSALAAWKIVKDVRVCGETVGVKTVVKIGITTILIFILIIGIALVMFALI